MMEDDKIHDFSCEIFPTIRLFQMAALDMIDPAKGKPDVDPVVGIAAKEWPSQLLFTMDG
jgi:hypothetical protein